MPQARTIVINLALALAVIVPAAFARQDAAPSQPIVSVAPLDQLDQSPGLSWLGRAIQQSIEVELTRQAGVRTVEPSSGGSTNVTLILRGNYQVLGPITRVNASILDPADNSTLSAWIVTGSTEDIRQLEDDCATRAARAVRTEIFRRSEPASARETPMTLTRDQAVAALGLTTSPRLAPAPKPVAGQRDTRPYDIRYDLYHYQYFYQWPVPSLYCGYFGNCGCFGFPCGSCYFGCCGFHGGPQATVGFATGGY